MLDGLLIGFQVALTPFNLILALLGAFGGTLIGALPGIGPINGVAVLLPICYSLGLEPSSALILLAAVYYGAQYGGRISSILLNVPGDAGAVMTAIEGHPMAKANQAGRALGLSAVSSFVGGMLGIILLTLFGPLMSKMAIAFGPPEYVALIVFAFATLSSMIGHEPLKTLLALLIGLALATVGMDSGTGVARFTFGSVTLLSGIDFMVVVIGLFGICELLSLLERHHVEGATRGKMDRSRVSWADLLQVKFTILRSTVIGFLIGVLPGTGASVASAISYSNERKLLQGKSSPPFGTGNIHGLAAPEAANNAAVSGAMVPMLTLGVPGSGTTAILMGALLLFNITPGPTLFVNEPEIVWGLVASMFIGNLILLVINLPMVGLFARILLLPQAILIPGIAMLGFVGVYSVLGSSFDLYLAIILGAMGYLLSRAKVPLVPIILGIVLGGIFEQNLRRSLAMSGGNYGIFLQGWIVLFIYFLTLVVILLPFWQRGRAKKKGEKQDEVEGEDLSLVDD